MIETKEKAIGDATYSVTQLPARRALRLKAKLIKLFGPFLMQYSMSFAEVEEKIPVKHNELTDDRYWKLKKEEAKRDSIVKAIQLLATSIDEKTFEDISTELLQGVRRNGTELNAGNIDQVFAGNLATLYMVLFFVLEVNYADFFSQDGIGSQFQEAINPTQDLRKTYTYK